MENFLDSKRSKLVILSNVVDKLRTYENQCYVKDHLSEYLSFDIFSVALDEQTGDYFRIVRKYEPGYNPTCLGEYVVTLNIKNPYLIEMKSDMDFHITKNKLNEIYWDVMYSFFGEEYKTALLNYLDSNKEQLDDYDLKVSFVQKLGATTNSNL